MSKSSFNCPDDFCPSCSHKLDRATPTIGKEGPSPGDVSICAYCGEILEYQTDLKVQIISEITFSQLSIKQIQYIVKIREAIKLNSILK